MSSHPINTRLIEIEAQLPQAMDRLLDIEARRSPEDEDYFDAVVNFGALALEKHDITSEKPAVILAFPPIMPWIATARDTIQEYVDQDPKARKLLYGCVFMSEDDEQIRDLNRLVFGKLAIRALTKLTAKR